MKAVKLLIFPFFIKFDIHCNFFLKLQKLIDIELKIHHKLNAKWNILLLFKNYIKLRVYYN